MPNSRNRRQKTIAKKKQTKSVNTVQKSNKTNEETMTFRWGESYTSLLLGIIVVIIGILFVVSFARMQHVKQVTTIATNLLSSTQIPLHATTKPKPASQRVIVTQEISPQKTVIHGTTFGTITKQLSQEPTKPPKLIPTTTSTPMQQTSTKPLAGQQIYTVVAGDDLWHIAEKFYHSGYNYSDIVRANKLENPGLLFSGMKLVIPQTITPEPQTITPTPTVVIQNTPSSQKISKQNGSAITGKTYTVQKDDDLWDIAIRAYGNGYRWTEIARVNNLSEPSKIFSGNVLTIPR